MQIRVSLGQAARWIWQRGGQWLGRCLRACRTCRECQRPVSLMTDICPHCGVSSPVKISLSPSVLVVAFSSESILLLLHWTY